MVSCLPRYSYSERGFILLWPKWWIKPQALLLLSSFRNKSNTNEESVSWVYACLLLWADPLVHADPIRVYFSGIVVSCWCCLSSPTGAWLLPNAVAGRWGLAEVDAKLLEALCEGGHGWLYRVEWRCVNGDEGTGSRRCQVEGRGRDLRAANEVVTSPSFQKKKFHDQDWLKTRKIEQELLGVRDKEKAQRICMIYDVWCMVKTNSERKRRGKTPSSPHALPPVWVFLLPLSSIIAPFSLYFFSFFFDTIDLAILEWFAIVNPWPHPFPLFSEARWHSQAGCNVQKVNQETPKKHIRP